MVAKPAASGVAREHAMQGFVERLDENDGVEGWAVDVLEPARALTIELWAGATCLATTQTGRERPDVCAALAIEGRPGFRFVPEIGDTIRAAATNGCDDDLTVRVAGMPAGTSLPGAVRNLEIVGLGRLADTPVTDGTLLDLLAIQARAAARALGRPFLPRSDEPAGLLEALAVDEAGFVWVTGWIVEDAAPDCPVVVLDDHHHPAGMAYAVVRRDDLPAGHVGFVGVLLTRWRPTSTAAPNLLIADGGERFLAPLLPTPLRTREELEPLIAHYLARSEGRYRDPLRTLFHLAAHWSVPVDRSAAERLQIDDVALLPGFGAFVSGWALSPSKEAEGFSLKVGPRAIVADARSIARHERPDIAAVYPDMADTIGTAGFVALFRGAFDQGGHDDLIVKTTWSDGSSTNDRVLPNTLRVLGVTTPLDAACRFYPELAAEHFFADFARHAARNARAQASEARGYAVQPVATVLILAAPKTSSDLFLLYDNALRHAAALGPAWGIAILAEQDHLRPLVMSLFADLAHATGRRCSLFFTRRGRPSTDAIEALLDALGATRFAFVEAGLSLCAAGWTAIERATGELTLLAARDPATGGSAPSARLDAFVADRTAWQGLVARAAPRIGGIALAPETVARQIVADAAVSLGAASFTPLVARINQAIERHDG